MNIIIVSTALDPRHEQLANIFAKKGFTALFHWIGTKEWPEFSSDVTGIVFLENGRFGVLDTIIEARQKTRGYQPIPLLVVPNDFGPKARVKYISAGATHLCSPDESNERIVAEIQARFEFDSSETEQTRLQLLQPFIAATIEAMDIMAAVNVEVDQVLRKKAYGMDGDVSGVIYLIGKTERLLAITFPEQAANELSAKVLAEVTHHPTAEMVADCVGEIINVVAGQVKGRFVHTDYEFDISTPTVITGSNHEIRHKSDLPCYTMTFDGDLGNFSLQLCVSGAERPIKGEGK